MTASRLLGAAAAAACVILLSFAARNLAACFHHFGAADPTAMAARLLGTTAACVIYCLLQLDLVNCIGVAASRLR